MRRLSLDAGLGENYVSQRFGGNKVRVPKVDYLMKLLKALGREKALFVIGAFEIDPKREKLLEVAQDWSPEEIEGVVQAWRAFRDSLPTRGPLLLKSPESDRKHPKS